MGRKFWTAAGIALFLTVAQVHLVLKLADFLVWVAVLLGAQPPAYR